MATPKSKVRLTLADEQTVYRKIEKIDGTHPLQEQVPFSHMSYAVRRRRDGKVAYFNFPLAKEMGLIDKNHPHVLNPDLKKSLIEAFSQIIINEYDVLNEIKFPKRDVKENRYMATRYLQLQHPDRRGLSSGDGRSLWNGIVKSHGKTWDITSCGTGATCLSPATAIFKKFFQSGDPDVSYGCGYAMVEEGLSDALFSESLHVNGIATERVLCIVKYEDGYGVKVRAGQNLLRPSHFFLHLKQSHHDRLVAMTDYYIDRQISNGTWAPVPKGENRYDYFLEKVTTIFAGISAQFESEYIFCWMDWDGDNILADGGLIDFGSIRQLGLFHHEYRFDDDDRWSTNIKEQRLKARDIVQTFAQMVKFVKTGRKENHRKFRNHKTLKRFDQIYTDRKQELLLSKTGFTATQIAWLRQHCKRTIARYEKAFYYFERAKSRRGQVKVADGVSWNAIFCMRDMLRELPVVLQSSISRRLSTREFLAILRSDYASRKDLTVTPGRVRRGIQFQEAYTSLISALAREADVAPEKILRRLAGRSAVINRYERITGDAISTVGEALQKNLEELSSKELQQFVERFVVLQNLNPETKRSLSIAHSSKRPKVDELLAEAQATVKLYREGL